MNPADVHAYAERDPGYTAVASRAVVAAFRVARIVARRHGHHVVAACCTCGTAWCQECGPTGICGHSGAGADAA